MFDDNFENGLLEWKRIALFKVPPNANVSLDDRMYRLDDSKKYQEAMALIRQKYFNVQIEGQTCSRKSKCLLPCPKRLKLLQD